MPMSLSLAFTPFIIRRFQGSKTIYEYKITLQIQRNKKNSSLLLLLVKGRKSVLSSPLLKSLSPNLFREEEGGGVSNEESK
jgi:hypothetical protein